jgi:orotate phosphoribosyltransferase
MKEQDVIALFEKHNALLKGHFKLSSGLHSERYLQCALLLQYPEYAEMMGRGIAEHFKDDNVTLVAGPAIGGIVIAHEVARALKVPCVFGEREEGKMTLRRGFTVKPADRILVVEDVITTGGSLKELADYLNSTGAKVVGAASIMDRSEKPVDFGVKRASLARLKVATYDPANCPLCKAGSPAIKPGSRK